MVRLILASELSKSLARVRPAGPAPTIAIEGAEFMAVGVSWWLESSLVGEYLDVRHEVSTTDCFS